MNIGNHNELDPGRHTIGVNVPMNLQEAVFPHGKHMRCGGSFETENAARGTIRHKISSPHAAPTLHPITISCTIVNNRANIQASSQVEGNAVSLGIYLTSLDINTGEATLAETLYDAEGT